ncbi:hypothetical protein DFQ28_003665 [Apophysomyces sp. BC1034]|nr:hypothetical protein DFQ28_003665 [Apophysomyces sp. BC1034]
MSWIQKAIEDYFNTVPARRVSYTNFLYQSESVIRSQLRTPTDTCHLKAALPEDAPRKVLRRMDVQSFWTSLASSISVKSIGQDFEDSALRLLGAARETSEKRIMRQLQQQSTSSAIPSMSTDEATAATPSDNTEEADNPFVDVTPAERVRSKILEYRLGDNHIETLHKQDLLFYGIIDLISSSSTAAFSIIAAPDVQEIVRMTKRKGPRPRNTQMVAARQDFRSHQDKAAWKRMAIKIMKEIRDQFSLEGVCYLTQHQPEMNYIATFLSPLFKILFKGCSDLHFLWGDQTLLAAKEEEHLAQGDHEKRSKGTALDTVISLPHFRLQLALVEVSGPPNTSDHAHFVGDRTKLAKNLKSMLKRIWRMSTHAFAVNKMYVYSLSQPARGAYVLDSVLEFDVSCASQMLPMFLPKFLKHLWRVKELIMNSTWSVGDYINSGSLSDSSANSTDSRDTVYISPKRRKTKAQ